MSDTPETDAEKFFSDHHGYYVVHAEHAEDLERERDAFEKRLFDVRDVLCDAMPDANAPTKILAEMLVQERDRYQEQADALVDRLGVTQERMIDAESERDSAIKNASNNLHQYVKANLRIEEIKSERDLWKAEAERWREIKK